MDRLAKAWTGVQGHLYEVDSLGEERDGLPIFWGGNGDGAWLGWVEGTFFWRWWVMTRS